ncbi:MAG: SCO family protein [Gammaproteobacteria bacterium]|nr:SCO family protein [Gammaproteobacteria bacterium]
MRLIKQTTLWLCAALLLIACDQEQTSDNGLTESVVTQKAERNLGIASHENSILVPAAGWGNMQFEPPVPGTYDLPIFGDAGDGWVLTEDGERKRLSEFFGDKIVIMSFIYTQCSDLNGCPLVTAVFYKIKQRLLNNPELADKIRLISLSFDPIHDTPEVMKFYGQGSQDMGGLEWQFLTTESEAELFPITESFGQYVNREYDEAGNPTNNFAHILRVFLIDQNTKKRSQYSAGFLHEQSLVSDVKTILMEGLQ